MTSCSAQETSPFRQALAQNGGNQTVPTPLADITMRQTYIWVSVILAVVLLFSVMALLNMDSDAEKDTILYAKFLRVADAPRN